MAPEHFRVVSTVASQVPNRVLKERMGGRRLRFADAKRRRLARKAQALGRKVSNELETLVTPDTLLRWYRELAEFKWNYSRRRGPGRPRVMRTIADLIVRMALDNPSWGIVEFEARWRIWGIRWGAAPSPTSSRRTALSRHPSGTVARDGEGSLGMSGSGR
jgi:hypothetical protein